MVVEQDQLSQLDDPVWNALSTTHASFAEGNRLAKRYPVDVAPFAGTRDRSEESYDSLAHVLGSNGTAALVSSKRPDLPAGWSFVRLVDSVRMAWNGSVPPPVVHAIVDLNVSHVQDMLALTELTRPGPFSIRTPELGSYFGVREAGQLVAMAGERLRLTGYTEISAVCTHPDYRGRGYAGSLVSALIQRITGRNETPFLHVRQENIGARRLYEKLGFNLRSMMSIAVVKKD